MTEGLLPDEELAIAGPKRHAYPHDLAELVEARWREVDAPKREYPVGTLVSASSIPELAMLERLLSVCYQASSLREEGRPVTFRVAFGEPDMFPASEGPPGGLHRLLLAPFRPFDRHELQRLAPAADFHRALIGVRLDMKGDLEIWGVIHSGPRWLQSVRGGRDIQQVVPPVLMVAVTGPGRLSVSKGTTTIAELSSGSLGTVAMDVFDAPWFPQIFASIPRVHQVALEAPKEPASRPWDVLDPGFASLLFGHVLRRIVATIRGARHGGTLVLLPAERSVETLADGRYITLKYAFHDEEPRRRIVTTTAQIMEELAKLYGGDPGEGSHVGWFHYEAIADPALGELDEALFEVAHLLAGFAQVDGALVLTNALEVLGFGGEISGALPEISHVARALDLEGTEYEWVRTDRVGTRHRSVYRLCQALHEAVAIVVSQDGGVRFVRWHEERQRVTYWNQVATGPWEV